MLKLLKVSKKNVTCVVRDLIKRTPLPSEYLLELYSNGNKDNKDIFTLKTNKYIYRLELPYNNKYTNEYGYIHNYNDGIMSICKKYNIDTKYYFNVDIKDDNILPFDTCYFSEIGKYLPLNDYSHIY